MKSSRGPEANSEDAAWYVQFMKDLPAKGLARALGGIAMAGCAMSLTIHVFALLGFHSKAMLHFQMALLAGIFPLALASFLAQQRLVSKLPSENLWRAGRRNQKVAEAHAPEWLRKTKTTLFAYYFLVFLWFMFENHSVKVAPEPDVVRMFSAGAAVFYSALATVLISYAETERRPTAEDLPHSAVQVD